MCYSAVARRTVILCDYVYTSQKGRFDIVALSVLSKVPQDNMIHYYVEDQNIIHVLVETPFTYLCISDMSFSNEKAFQFLLKIKQDFSSRFYQCALNASAFKLRNQFSVVLKVEMSCFSHIQLGDKAMKVKSIVNVSIKGLKFSQERSSQLNNTGSRPQQKTWWENVKTWLLLNCHCTDCDSNHYQ